MKNLFKLIVVVSFAITLIACGRMGDLTPVGEIQVDAEVSTSGS